VLLSSAWEGKQSAPRQHIVRVGYHHKDMAIVIVRHM
jgi:hypothetical protein